MIFPGFVDPKENWSKLPHDFIAALHEVETLAELKVILYILRHTWGFHDASKKITLDEFSNGRKRKDETRLDGGTGMSVNSVKDGIDRAIEHGFIVIAEQDLSDKARPKTWYSLRVSEVDTQPSIPDDQPSEVDPRTEKETLERNHKKSETQAQVSESPIVDITYGAAILPGNEDVIVKVGEEQTALSSLDRKTQEDMRAEMGKNPPGPYVYGRKKNPPITEVKIANLPDSIRNSVEHPAVPKTLAPTTELGRYLAEQSVYGNRKWTGFASAGERDDWLRMEESFSYNDIKEEIDWACNQKRFGKAKLVHNIISAVNNQKRTISKDSEEHLDPSKVL